MSLVILLAMGSIAGGKDKRYSEEIVTEAIEGKLEKPAYWLLMDSSVASGGWSKLILVFGYWDNSQACDELKIWGKSNPHRKHRRFRCERVK